MENEIKLPEYFGKISTAYAQRLLGDYDKRSHDDSLSGFLKGLYDLERVDKLFNKHGKEFQGRLPHIEDFTEDFEMLDIVPTPEGKLYCANFHTAVEISTKDDPAPGYDDIVFIPRKAYDAVINDVAKMKKKMPGVELHYALEDRLVPCARYDGSTIWNPDGEMIYDDNGVEFDEDAK